MAISWQEAAGILAEERAFAESGAGFLKTYAAKDQAALLVPRIGERCRAGRSPLSGIGSY